MAKIDKKFEEIIYSNQSDYLNLLKNNEFEGISLFEFDTYEMENEATRLVVFLLERKFEYFVVLYGSEISEDEEMTNYYVFFKNEDAIKESLKGINNG